MQQELLPHCSRQPCTVPAWLGQSIPSPTWQLFLTCLDVQTNTCWRGGYSRFSCCGGQTSDVQHPEHGWMLSRQGHRSYSCQGRDAPLWKTRVGVTSVESLCLFLKSILHLSPREERSRAAFDLFWRCRFAFFFFIF